MRNQVQEIVSSMKEKSNFTPEYCLILGSGFVNMTELYSQKMILKAKELAQKWNIEVKEGIYLALLGPTFETLVE